MPRVWVRYCCVALTVALCPAIIIGQSQASSIAGVASGKKATDQPMVNVTAAIGGPERFQTFLSTDKPIYRAAEKVYMRGVVLNAANHKPLLNAQNANASIEIKGPKGETVANGNTSITDSVWGFAWDVPQGQAGGEYTIHVNYPGSGFPPAERKFDIRDYRAPRLKSQIVFLRDGYGPGEKVQATLEVKRAEGGIPEGAKVTVTANIDGQQIDGGIGKVDATGLCSVSIDLPKEISRGEGTLALVIEDGGVVETAAKTIPILLQTVDLNIFPEGGDLVAGFKNRVYIQANQPNGKPADLIAKLIATQGSETETVTEFRTEHEGRGRFEFVPNPDKEYTLSIVEPVGIKTTYKLPSVKTMGATIHSDRDVFRKDQPISVQVGCTDRHFRVTLSKRDVQLGACDVNSSSKNGHLRPVSFNVPSDVDGVMTVTVWDSNGQPLAERLLFREPSKPLHISITPDQKNYIPGDSAKLKIKATDSDGKPVSTVVGITVTDDSILEMVEKREQAPHLPVMVFLEPEVKGLADAHVYLEPNNPKAPLATDLLLGTQGWRRFALVDVNKFMQKYGDDAKRVVAYQTHPYVANIGMMGGQTGQLAALSSVDRGRGAWSGVAVGAAVGAGSPSLRKGHRKEVPLPPDLGAAQAPRDANMFQVEPTVVDERHYTSGRDERHKKTSPTLPEGSPIPDNEGAPAAKAQGIIAPAQGQPVPFSKLVRKGNQQARIMPLALMDMAPAPPPYVSVREFAHEVRPNRKPTDRVDFAETLYWNAGVKTDPKTGEATVSFGLNDSVTTFRVFADGFAESGAIGANNVGIESVQPFYAEAKMPLEVTSGDHILLPVSLVNATANNLGNPDLKVSADSSFKVGTIESGGSTINAKERVRWIEPIDVGFANGKKDVVLDVHAGAYADKVTRELSVKPKGFPVATAFGGMLEPGKPVVHVINIPQGVVPHSIVSNTAVYPTPLANLTEALQRMIQDPCGCFEQTSSTSYPLTMAQQYFLSHTGVDPKLIETSREKLDVGYKHLVGFWCPDRGYEWFGENPGHEALTAFGLLHFTDMSKVRDVDQNMIVTTRAWLLKQKDGNGGFSRKRRALHTWIEDKDCSNAYILWALLETGQSASDLKPELDSIKTAAGTSQNNYVVALAANALYLSGQKAEAKKLMDRLVAKQKADGSVDGVTSSIVGSGGESLEVEGTALATLAWLRDPAYAGSVEKSIKYLADSCKDGRYGSTQATVLALRAIVNYDKMRSRPKEPGKVQVYVDGQAVGDWVAFDKNTQGAIKLPDMSELLTAGQHKLELRMNGGGEMPYSLAVNYNAATPDSDKDCKLDVSTTMSQSTVQEGAATEAKVTVTNKTNDVIPNPVAVIGLPGGLEARHDQLKELVKKGTIDAYEVRGREVVLYWRTLAGDAKVVIPISVIAAVPGTYTGPASRAYLYYTDEQKNWVDGMHIDITPKSAIASSKNAVSSAR